MQQNSPFRQGRRGASVVEEEPGIARQRRRRRRIRIAALALALLLAYPVLGTLALWTGLVESMARSEDLRVEIANPSYTLWPGRFHMKHVRLLVNGDTQFILEGKDLTVNIRVFPLFSRRIHVTKLAAEGVRYQMRVQVEDTKGIERRIAAYPPLEGLPGADVVRQKVAEKTEEREASWTVETEGLDVAVEELWFFEYRYLGDGRLRGGFLVGPQRMRVTTAVQDLGPGELRFGPEQVIATRFRGQVTADIPEVNPEEHADASFFELVMARINLRADVQSLEHLTAYLQGMAVSQGAGPFAVDFHLEKGILGQKSRLDYVTQRVGLKGSGFGVETDLKLDLDASGERNTGASPDAENDSGAKKTALDVAAAKAPVLPLLRSESRASYVSLARAEREFTVQIHGHQEEVVLDTIRLSDSTRLKRAVVRMPKIVTSDLDDFAVALPEGTPLEVRSGELTGSVELHMDEDYWTRGPIRMNLEGLDMTLAGVRVNGNAALRARARANPKLETHGVEDLAIELRKVGMHVGDEDVDGWWMNITSPRLTLWASEPPRMEGALGIRAKDLEPVLEGLAEKDVINDLIAKFTSLDDFRCRLNFRKLGDVTDVTMESESDVWDASGRFYGKGERSKMAFVVGGQAVSIGVADLGGGIEVMPFAKTGWLNERLRAFPQPIELPPAKP
ncbi:MAG TPA: hypothetical protein VIM73_14605 [Polyangiaceae bacterium]